jgi:hypothetical protein
MDDQRVMVTSRPSQRLVPRTEASFSAALVERVSAWMLKGPLTLALLGLCAFQLATWLPHYLTWPWFADHDVFATLALGWEHGQLPYRDLLGNNFPGTVYLFWIVGKVFGWGKTLPFLAVDAGFLLTLGLTLFVWSGRRFGRLLPGVVAYAVFLSYYLNLDFSRVAQRDWHGPFFVVVGLLLADAYPGSWSRRLAALTTAIGFVIRPQIVLLLPAVVLAVAQGTRQESDPSNRRTVRILLGWGLLLTVLIVLAFQPLVWSGIWDDFLRGVRLTFYGARYNKATPGSILTQMVLQALHLEFIIAPLAVLVLAPLGDARTRGTAWVWLLASLGAWFYKPMSPVPFPYLEHPLTLIWAVTIGVLVQLLMTPGLAHPAIRLAAVLVAMRLGVHARPGQCSVSYARQGLATLQRGTDPDEAPLGIHIALPSDSRSTAFPWNDYRETLAYLRTQVDPSTRVANLLHVVPALNGPSGRLTPLPAESLAWLGVHPDDEPAFQRALERADANSVVVWTPVKGKFNDLWSHYAEVERLAPVIRRYYEPMARFGDVEVWSRKAEGAHGASDPAS